MLLYEQEQFLVILLYLHVTFGIWDSCDLFNAVSSYKFFWHWSIALSTCVEACFVEESIDSLPILNLEFCSVTFDFLFVESLKEEGEILEVKYNVNLFKVRKKFHFYKYLLHVASKKLIKSKFFALFNHRLFKKTHPYTILPPQLYSIPVSK